MSQPSGCSGRDIGGISLPTPQPVRCRRFQRAARTLQMTLQTHRQVYFKVDYFETFKSTLRGDETLFSVSQFDYNILNNLRKFKPTNTILNKYFN